MPAPTIYKSSDSGAPTLDGQAGSLIAVLDACLVNGYGSKAAAGWTKPYSGTNTAVYQPVDGHPLDVNDNGAGAGTTQEATVRGYESMTAVATGTNPFPTTAQQAAPGIYIRKSTTATSTARGWVLIADGYTFHLFTLPADTTSAYQGFSYGRFYSFKSGDAYRTMIFGKTVSGVNAGGLGISPASSAGTGTSGLYAPRTHAATGTSIQMSVNGIGSVITNPWPGPNSADGLVYISRWLLGESLVGVRGYVRGIYQMLTGNSMSDGDTFTGSGDFAGRTFLVLKGAANTVNTYLVIETSAWDSSS